MRHHIDRVDPELRVQLLHPLHHLVGDALGAGRPDVDHLVVLLAFGDQAVDILLLVFLDLLLSLGDELALGGRDHEIVLAEGDARLAGLAESELHHAVAEDHRLFLATVAVDDIDDVCDVLLGQHAVDQREGHVRMLRQDLRDQHPASGRVDALDDRIALGIDRLEPRLDLGVQRRGTALERMLHLAQAGEGGAFARLVVELHRKIVESEHDVLRRHDDRLAVRRRQDVVGRHHQDARFELRFQRKRYVNRHLVAVEVGVEGGADQRVQLDRLAFDQRRLESLNTQPVQGRRPVQQDRMFADDLLEDVPNLRTLFLYHALRRLDGRRHAVELELVIDERLEQLERHLLRQAALVQLELGTDDDHRTTRIVDALAEQVLTEPALFALQHVRQRLQRALVGAGYDAAAAAIVEQRVHRLLQHPLFIAHDDIGRAELDQSLQTIVAVDHAAVEIVQIRGREATAIQRNQRTQLGRDHRHDREDHPFRTRAGLDEGLDELQTLDQLLALGLRRGLAQLVTDFGALLGQIDLLEHFLERLCADPGAEALIAIFLLSVEILLLAHQLMELEGRHARLDNNEILEIENPLELLQRHVEHEADTAGKRLHEPDMRDRRGELDMAHALAPDLLQRDFDAAFLADDALVLHALVLAAQALIVLDRAEDAGAEQAVALRLEGPVVDGLGLLDLAERPGANLLRARDRDSDLVEALRPRHLSENLHQFIHAHLPLRDCLSLRGLAKRRAIPCARVNNSVASGRHRDRATSAPSRGR